MGQKLPEPHFTDRRKSLSPSPNTTFFTPSSNFVTWLHLPSGLRTKCAYLRVSEMHRQSKAEHDGQVKDSSSRSIRNVIHGTHSRRKMPCSSQNCLISSMSSGTRTYGMPFASRRPHSIVPKYPPVLLGVTQGTLRPDPIEIDFLSRKRLHCFCALD